MANHKMEAGLYTGSDEYVNQLEKYRLLELNESALNGLLNLTKRVKPREESTEAGVELSLPLPDGHFIKVNAVPVTVIANQAAKASPDFRTWRIQGINDPLVTGIIDSSSSGFHGMIILSNGETVLINPIQDKKTRKYISFSERSTTNRQADDFSCAAGDQHTISSASKSSLDQFGISEATAFRRGTPTAPLYYEIIYTASKNLLNNVGGVTALNNTINTMHARINALFWRDTAIALIGTASYFDAGNNYLSDTSSSNLMNTNPVFMKALKASNPTVPALKTYDLSIALGYLLTGGGGLAEVSTVCGSSKDYAALTSHTPNGTEYYRLVAHEIGHQFGAQHTFNKCITRNGESARIKGSAVEPGSGATIMGYGMACLAPNGYVLDASVPLSNMFHINSISQIVTFSRGTGSSCALVSDILNNPPVVYTPAAYTIPARTPFMLSGSASDAERHLLSYSWEQVDTIALLDFGTAVNLHEDNGKDALIRVLPPKTTPFRYIPDLPKLLSNAETQGDYLPVTSRKLSFELAVRDQQGGVGSNITTLTVKDSGVAFAITNPASSVTDLRSFAGKDFNVRWNVAGTNASEFNCPTVDIGITTNNGASFSTLALYATNNGARTVRLPSTLPTKSHIRVICSGGKNIFFAISGTNPRLAIRK
ncbi:reprolysin-like metallopeptidase [uncultured Thiothrix sp.]|uniref:reprolysin-like metallopeptidase n=1 Tax=uncultured Thiothrix sp. TaxID=223185 RepID=UPI00262A2968|nr:zinc-dependent metalloprotease family protein [uncultured Thiothrix sp.]HMT94275.1 M12 family metallo-peptidase [Thiolinea sp.]